VSLGALKLFHITSRLREVAIPPKIYPLEWNDELRNFWELDWYLG